MEDPSGLSEKYLNAIVETSRLIVLFDKRTLLNFPLKILIKSYDYGVKSLKMINKLITRKLFSIKSLQVFVYVMREISNK